MSVFNPPDKILYSDFGGDWPKFCDALYSKFKQDFVNSKPKIPNRRVGLKAHPMIQNKEATFWHFISEGKNEEDRLPDIPRSEFLPWIRPMIELYGATNLKVWSKRHKGNEVRVLIAIEDFSYLIVLADRGEYVLPWTAYPIIFESQRNKYKREFEDFKKKLGAHSSYDPFTPSTTG